MKTHYFTTKTFFPIWSFVSNEITRKTTWAQYVLLFSFIILSQVVSGQQCPVTPCDMVHQTLVNLATIPECGVGSVNLNGDLSMGQSDCRNGTINCHEFIMYRPSGSLTQQFTLEVGQGSGCNGELDASYGYIDGVCYTLSTGGSNTVIQFDFPINVDTIYLFFCLNSSAHVTICDLCTEPPPCSQLPICNLTDVDTTGCLANVPPALSNPADVFTNIGTCAGTTLILDHVDSGDTTFCADANGVNFTRTYTLYFLDDQGDTIQFRECIQNIQVTPIPVAVACPADITIECTASTLPANTGTPGSSDNCSSPVVDYDDVTAAGACLQELTITRTWNITDGCGNTSTCTQIITVDDSTPPTLTCPASVTIECLASTLPEDRGTATATDNCSTPTVSYSDVIVPGLCPLGQLITRTWLAIDECGNSSTCNQTINVDDSTPPVINCPPDVTIECTASTSPDNNGMATATDNCSAPSVDFSDVTAAGACPQELTITRTWIAIDECGNSSTCNQTIHVDDSTPPSITCPTDLVLECGDGSDYPSLINAWVSLATATDLCGSVTLSDDYDDISIPAVSCDLTNGLVITFTATDDCGNTSACTATVYMDDTVSPLITCPADLTLQCAPGAIYADTILAWIAKATATDACDQTVTITTDYDGVSTAPFSCTGNGLDITFTATDECGNTATCTRTVYKPCFDIETAVYIEGSVANPNGLPTNTIPMRTTLNDLQMLPGQTIFDPFFGDRYNPPGQPYDIAPWFYLGTEGDLYDSGGIPGDAGYPSTVVDWVLVSLRDDIAGIGGPNCQAAALLHSDGHIEFVEEFDCCNAEGADSFYIVIEHRNHLIVMSDSSVAFVNGNLSYDFRGTDSYVEDFGFPGLFIGQKQISPGVWVMYGGNGHQTSLFSDTDINFNDRTYFELQNGIFGEYRIADYNLNGDVNFNDRLLYEKNNGLFTSVPRD